MRLYHDVSKIKEGIIADEIMKSSNLEDDKYIVSDPVVVLSEEGELRIPSIDKMKKDRRIKKIIKKKAGFYYVELKPGYRCLMSGGHIFTADNRKTIYMNLLNNIRICRCSRCLESS